MRRWVVLLALLTLAPGLSAQTLPSDLAALFGYQSGVEVIPATIQYLNERAKMEV